MLKGSFPLQQTAVIILGVLGLVIGYQTVTTIHAQTLDPSAGTIERTLESISGEEITIGGNYVDANGDTVDKVRPNDARKQFRAAVAFNALRGANCKLINVAQVGAEKNKAWFAYLNEDGDDKKEGFDILLNQTDFQGNCWGAEAIQLLPTKAEAIQTGFDALPGVNGMKTQGENDNEGRYGKTDFNINKTFWTNKWNQDVQQQNKLLWLNLDSNGAEIFKTGMFDANKLPDFYRGDRTMAFVPGGLTPKADVREHYAGGARDPLIELYQWKEDGRERDAWFSGHFWNHKPIRNPQKAQFYYWRVRMQNVPIMIPSTSNDGDGLFFKINPQSNFLGDHNKGSYGDNQLERFVEDARYLFCKGTEGHIQTNAKNLASGDDYSHPKAHKADGVYPFVRITSGNKRTCIPSGNRNGWNAFYGFEAPSLEDSTCSITEAMNRERRDIELENGLALHCGMRLEYAEFPAFEGRIPYWRPGWFTEGCPSESKIPSGNEPYSVSNRCPDKEHLPWENPTRGGKPSTICPGLSEDVCTDVWDECIWMGQTDEEERRDRRTSGTTHVPESAQPDVEIEGGEYCTAEGELVSRLR